MSPDFSTRDFDLLRAIAETGRLSAAARAIGVTQPAATQRLRSIEQRAGTVLVDRDARGAQLNAKGRRFVAGGGAAFGRVLQAFEDVRAGPSTARLEIGFTITTEHDIVPPLTEVMSEELTEAAYSLHRRWTSDLSADVDAGRLDVGFARHPEVWGAMRSELLWDDRLELWVAASHPLSGRARVDLAELAGESIAVIPRSLSPGAYDVIEGACHDAGFVPALVTPPLTPTSLEGESAELWFDQVVALRASSQSTDYLPDIVRIPLVQTVRIGMHMVSLTTNERPEVHRFRAAMRARTANRRRQGA